MNNYLIYNFCLLLLLIILLAIFGCSKSEFIKFNKVSTILVLIGFPWDYFAIHLGVWEYPQNPGIRFYHVPINDLIFIYVSSMIASLFWAVFVFRKIKRAN